MTELFRYPRTRHLEGSFLAVDDHHEDTLSFERFAHRHIVVTEKVDGANAAVSFARDGRLVLQSRSRLLAEEHLARGPYADLHRFTQALADDLFRALGTRYVMYGEWAQKKHGVFYDALPAAFLELDVLDTHTHTFLASRERRALLAGLPVASTPVLAEGTFATRDELARLMGPSRLKTPQWRAALLDAVQHVPDAEKFVRETDPSDDMEGLYLKVEEDGVVTDRAKLVRHGARTPFLYASTRSLLERIVDNRLV